MEQTAQSLMDTPLQLRTRPTESPPLQSSSSDEQSTDSRAPSRRRSVPSSKNTRTPPARINTSHTAGRSTKAMSAGPRSGANHGAIMQMSGTISPPHEITYTPTTHRISKAKKGKKVHACEYPGCTKIFTRAEHRKRHEANHNAVPAFQCDIEGCRKPFQRQDLLTRHMERQHNMPVASPPAQPSQSRRSRSSTSTLHSNPTTPSIVRPTIPQQHHPSLTQHLSHQPTRAMSIGSLVDQPSPMGGEYISHPHPHQLHQTFIDFSHLPVPTAPPLVYGLSASDSPYCSSDSCASPMSDFIQPQLATQQAQYLPDELPRTQSAGLECGFGQTVYTAMDPAATGWGYDQAPLSAPIAMSMTRHFQYPSPTIMSPETMGAPHGLHYGMSIPAQEQWSGYQ